MYVCNIEHILFLLRFYTHRNFYCILELSGQEFCFDILNRNYDNLYCSFFGVLRHIDTVSIGHIATFQLYWWRKTSGALPCIISGTDGHLSRTTDDP
jgi:hypothetical protein